MAGVFVIVLDFFIVNVALPAIQADLHATAGGLEWVVAGYGLAFAAILLSAGKLGDHVGRRRVFVIGLALFTAASTACGIAPTMPLLIASRVLQGLAAGLISPSVLSLISVLYSGTDRARAISVYAGVMGVASAGGQLLGGLLVQADIASLGWRSVFLINVPVGLAAIALVRRVPESRAPASPGLDVVGMTLATGGLIALVLPLIEGRQQGWPSWTWLSLATAALLLVVFAAHEVRTSQRGGTPLVDPSLFRVRSFSAGLTAQLALWSGQASYFLVLALYLQQGRGLDALQSGLMFTILAVAYLVTSLRAPALTMRYGRSLIALGATTLATGHVLMLLAVTLVGTGGPLIALAPGLALAGAGMGLTITPLTMTVLMSSDPKYAGAVSGTLSTMQQVGNALGVAVTGVIFFSVVPDGSHATAFQLSLVELIAVLMAVVAITRLLPRQTPPS
jgi:EmrB/QacA subfamily drug resistance transporter